MSASRGAGGGSVVLKGADGVGGDVVRCRGLGEGGGKLEEIGPRCAAQPETRAVGGTGA